MQNCVEEAKAERKHVTEYRKLLADYVHPKTNEFFKTAHERMGNDLIGTVAKSHFAITIFCNDSA